jgi:alkaline phosphatase D
VDFNVKVEIKNLAPATYYFYRFSTPTAAAGGAVASPLGLTRTLPAAAAEVASLSLATLSCAYWAYGAFTAYARVADRAADLDAVLHLGE